MSLNIKIITIDHKKQRYNTVGDWKYSSGTNLNIYISNMGDWRKEVLVAIHELTELILCKERKITQKEVDEFDKEYERRRKNQEGGLYEEPGDDPHAPYRKEHFFATSIERLICAELGVDWMEYEKTINNL